MAGRPLGKSHDKRTRDKIQTSQIINRLFSIGMGEVDSDATQVNALKALLIKTLPDLQSIEWKGEVTYSEASPDPYPTVGEWQKQQTSAGDPSPAPKPH